MRIWIAIWLGMGLLVACAAVTVPIGATASRADAGVTIAARVVIGLIVIGAAVSVVYALRWQARHDEDVLVEFLTSALDARERGRARGVAGDSPQV